MMKDITLGQYIPGDSLLHRADPRVKMLLLILLMAVVFMLKDLWAFICFMIFISIVLLLSGISWKMALKGLKPILFIILFTAVVNMFTVPGNVIFRLGFLKLTDTGVQMAVKMAMRLILLVVGASLLTYTTTPISLTDGMEKLMKPLTRLRFPAHEIAMMMSIALRFIPTILDETDKIMKAQSSRGADFDSGNFIQRAKSFVPILVPLFVSAFRRADELAVAMEARCYRGGEGRTRMHQLRLSMADLVITLILLTVCASILFLQFY
ncbi:MAG TPA: transporter [Clostridiales bacterium]|nr:transporter [Clostridiales bacterium]